jgi:hypothetical protein
MCSVVPPERLASAARVFCGQRGDITQHAQHRGVSRQRLYREAHSVLRDLDHAPQQQQAVTRLQQQVQDLHQQLQAGDAPAPAAVAITADLQAEFASTAQAEGVSLPVARRLLAVFLRDQTPSVATLGRHSRRAGLRAGPLLEVFDAYARPRVQQAAADEIFFGQRPVLMVVEPESQCWVAGRLAPSRDGEQWAKELEPLPALEHVVRDGGTGLANGLARVNAQRQQQQQAPISDQLDHFHTLREGRRALRKTQAQAERAWTRAEAADRKVARRQRHGQAKTGYQTQALRAWQQAEQAFHQWEEAEGILEQIRQALRPFTAQGELNTRQRAAQTVGALLPSLPGEHWDKFKRQLQRPESYSYLERLHRQIQALPVAAAVTEAVVRSVGVEQNPELVRGESPGAGVRRALLVVWSVLIALAGTVGVQAVATVRQALRCVGRASSCVEGLNSVVRMQQGRHRKMTQGLLDLKRLYWNLRQFRTGRRRKTSPYERLGVPLPADLSWWQFLRLTPEQLRNLLSAQHTTA